MDKYFCIFISQYLQKVWRFPALHKLLPFLEVEETDHEEDDTT